MKFLEVRMYPSDKLVWLNSRYIRYAVVTKTNANKALLVVDGFVGDMTMQLHEWLKQVHDL